MDIETELRQTTRFQRLVKLVSCDSTQAMAEADVGDDCAVFWADHQTAGRGREGRAWHDSPAEDIAVTFRITGLELPNPTHLAAAIPVAAIESIASIVPQTRIKWPNDLLLRGRKLCGVLIDSHGQPPHRHLIGVGMNINRSSFPSELVERSTSLALATGREFDRAERVLRLAQAIDRVATQLVDGELDQLARAFEHHLGLSGQPVEAVLAGRTIHGTLTALGLDHIVLDHVVLDQRQTAKIPLAHLHQLRRR